MKSIPYRSVMVAIALLAALSVGVSGCFGFGGGSDDGATVTTTAAVGPGGSSSATTTLPSDTTVAENDDLSTFRSKDPFIPQAQPVTTVGIPGDGTPGTTSGGSSGGTVSTISKPTIPSTVTTIPSGGPGGTTTETTTPTLTSSTSTTAPHVHTLKVLSASQVGGAAAVTFQVDGSVYRDKRVGDVVSTSWGQIKVVDINTSSRVVTLLQGSETLVLSVGQFIYQ